MRTVDAHLLEDKMDEVVTHYINSHQGETVHIDSNGLPLQDEGGRVVTVMHQSYSSHMTRLHSTSQVSVSEADGGGWSEELLDPDGRLAALVAHLTHQSRAGGSALHHNAHLKVSSRDMDAILDTPLRLFNGHGQSLEVSQPLELPVPPLAPLPPLPPLQEMKRNTWFTKTKATLKENGMVPEAETLELAASPHHKQSKKSLPHKKRISRKLKRNNGNCTPQQDVVVLNCSSSSATATHEEILPDSEQPHHAAHQVVHEMRAILICQICGEFYGEEQLKFYQHLKEHYEPHDTIIIENPVTELAIDKISNTCIVDNVASLPDSIVELSLEGTVPKSMYQPMDKHIMYSGDKPLYANRAQYTMSSMDKEATVANDGDKSELYDTLDKLDLYSCGKCNKSFRKQKLCEQHIKEAHGSKLEDMGEFSEPEDLMEGIHVAVEEGSEQYETLLPHLTVDNGHVHQEHVRHWYLRGGSGSIPACGGPAGYCPVCPRTDNASTTHHTNARHLKEEEIQHIFDTEVPSEQSFNDNIIPESELPQPQPPTQEITTTDNNETANTDKKKPKKFECRECGRVFVHRNSLLYHTLSHGTKREACNLCGKRFYTPAALKVHKRVHNGDRPYKCELCGREFRQWSDLKYHTVSLHSNQKHFKCEFCSKEFARKYSLNVHRRIHTGERNYKCDYCTKTFRASSYRLSHMRTHTGDKPYKCSSCDKCFRVAGDLRRHMIVHEKVRNRIEQAQKETKDKEKKHKDETEDIDKKKNVEPPPKIKKIAAASTTRPAVLKNASKKSKGAKKTHIKKEIDTPNVTITNNKNDQYKANTEYSSPIEVFDAREYSKFKEVYTEPGSFTKSNFENKEYSDSLSYKDGDQRIPIYKDAEQRLPIIKEGERRLPIYKDSDQRHIYKEEQRLPVFKEGERLQVLKDSDQRLATYKDGDQRLPTYKDEEHRIIYKDEDQRLNDEKDLAVLRPIYRSSVSEISEKPLVIRTENTDGKLQVFTQVEKTDNNVTLADVRALERDREHINEETGFLERLTFLYNIPAV